MECSCLTPRSIHFFFVFIHYLFQSMLILAGAFARCWNLRRKELFMAVVAKDPAFAGSYKTKTRNPSTSASGSLKSALRATGGRSGFSSRSTGGHTSTTSRATGGRSGLTSNRGTVPGVVIDVLANSPGLRNNSSALLQIVRGLSSVKDKLANLTSSSSASSIASGSSGTAGGYYDSGSGLDISSPTNPSGKAIDYFNADLAKHYGMENYVAYQEALSNTAYQRAVKDMQAAGLNPAALFGAGSGSVASGVGYISPAIDASYGSGLSSGSSVVRSGQKYGSIPNGLYNALKLAGGAAGALLMKKNPISGFWVGSSVADTALKAVSSFISGK